jgi:prepilin peptidase CpaA
MDIEIMNHPIALWAVSALVVVATVTDLRSRRIPNWLVLPCLVLGFVASAVAHGWSGVWQSLLGVLLPVVVLGIFCYLGGMGMGDLKLCAAIGAWIGPWQMTIALVMTSIAGGIMALAWAASGGFLKEALRGTGSLIRGAHKTLVLSHPARKMPYAPAIAIGTICSFLGRHI